MASRAEPCCLIFCRRAAALGIGAIVAEMTSSAIGRDCQFKTNCARAAGGDLPNSEFLNIIPKFARTGICAACDPGKTPGNFGLMFCISLVELSAEVHGCRVLAGMRQHACR